MKQALVLVLLAAAAFAEESKLTVRVELPAESLLEGERATAAFRIQNDGSAPVIPLSIEPVDAVEALGGRISLPLEAVEVTEEAAQGTIEVHRDVHKAAAPRVFDHLLRGVVLRPGEACSVEVGFKAPAGHLYAIHFKAVSVPLDRAVSEGRVYVKEELQEEVPGPARYRRADSADVVKDFVILRAQGLGPPDVAQVAIAVEVKPREFSFAAAAKEAGTVPDASTWFEARGLWALAAKGKTLLVGPDTRIELEGDYVPLLSELALEDRDTLALPAPDGEDPLAGFLREKGATDVSGKGDGRLLLIQVKDLPEVLQKADELGFEVTRDGWKKRQ